MTWLVKVALDRPYTFIVMALMILIFGPLAALRLLDIASTMPASARLARNADDSPTDAANLRHEALEGGSG